MIPGASVATPPPAPPPLPLPLVPALEAGEWLEAAALLAWRRQQLAGGGEPAAFDWLLEMAAGLPWSVLQALRLHPERQARLACSRTWIERLWSLHCRHNLPLQYLVGRCPWRDLELAVAPGVLIPRQETELLVDLALSTIADGPAPGLWADLGTGSGCLALALARALPGASGLATDLSAAALEQAGANGRTHGLAGRLAWLQGSWWQPLEPWWGQLELVVSNPPYIPTAVVAELDPVVRCHEPLLALDGGPDGLAAIRALVAGAPRGLAPGGWLLLEHHHDQSPAVVALLQAAGLDSVSAHRDLDGRLRFAAARRRLP